MIFKYILATVGLIASFTGTNFKLDFPSAAEAYDSCEILFWLLYFYKGGCFMFLITGDRHGNFDDLRLLAARLHTKQDDSVIILGDAGLNYFVEWDEEDGVYRDQGAVRAIKSLADVPLTFIIVQGNHEAPAWLCNYLHEEYSDLVKGPVYVSEEAPNVLFLKNGEIYTIHGKKYLVMGGADSIDKKYRQVPTWPGLLFCKSNWFPQEQMTDEEFDLARRNLESTGYEVHGVLAHTCPFSKQPRDLFLNDPEMVPDDRQEKIFEGMKAEFKFDIWYFGHFHADRKIDDGKYRMLFNKVEELE